MAVYEIRRGSIILCRGTLPQLGYSALTLKGMAQAGLQLYCDGKREKAASRGANTESGRPK